MHLYHQCSYFDGVSAKEYVANVEMQPDCWIITLADTQETFVWNIREIAVLTVAANEVTCRYGKYPEQLLTSRSLLFVRDVEQLINNKVFKSDTSFFIRKSTKNIAFFFTGVVAFCILFYTIILPWSAAFLAAKLPYSYQQEMGTSILNSLVDSADIDVALTEKMNDFAKQIDFKTEHELNIIVVNGYELNAFAVPGSNIVVYKRMVEEIPSAEALAALLAHEVAHEKKKHVIQSMARSIAGYLLISVVLNDVSGIAAVFVENASSLSQLKYSRSLEQEADKEGLAILANNRIDQRGFVELFQLLKKEDSQVNVSMLSTHPLTEDRLKYAKKIAGQQRNIAKNEALNSSFLLMKKVVE